jgi:hypothetical protein
LGMTTPLSETPSTEHREILLGLTPQTDCYYRVVTVDGENAAAGDIEKITTGDQPGGLPTIGTEGGGHDKYTIVPLLGQNKAVTIINAEGEYVWYYFADSDLDTYRARLSNDGESILFNQGSISGDPAENSSIVRLSLDGLQKTSIPIPLLAHDFVELPDGTLAAIAVEYRAADGGTEGTDGGIEGADGGTEEDEIKGNKIVEVSPDGSQSVVWTSWDCFDPVAEPGDDPDHGWTFANALDYDPVEDAYYIGLRSFSSIAKITRADYSCEWVLGGWASTISFAEGSTPMLHEHQFQVMESSILVFDNEGLAGQESRAVEFSLDFNSNLATQIWSYSSDPTVYTFVLGDVTRLEDKDTIVNWSVAGRIDRVSPEGDVKWSISTPMGFAFGFHTIADSLYQ